MRTVIGIDVGGSTTKIVGFRSNESKKELIAPMFVRAADAVTSIYGAFGKFTLENDIALDSIDRVMGIAEKKGSIEVGKQPGLAVISGIDLHTLQLTPESVSTRII